MTCGLKRMGLIVGLVVGWGIGYGQAGEFRDFTSSDGRTVRAQIVDYNGATGTVEVELENGKRTRVKPTVFSAEDQAYIQDWIKGQSIMSDSLLKVSCSEKLTEKWKDEEDGQVHYGGGEYETETVSVTKFERYTYELKLENRNAFPLENLTIKYRICYEQSEHNRDRKAIPAKKYKTGSLKIDRIEAKSKQVVTTDSVVLSCKQFTGDLIYSRGDPEKTDGRIDGIWLKIIMRLSSGETVEREVVDPKNIAKIYQWDGRD